jgi:hypothetical protein
VRQKMASRRRRPLAAGSRTRRVPARSRVTVRRSEAPLLRSTSLAAALRDSRPAISSLEGQLDEILRALRSSEVAPPAASADKLRGATRAAAAAIASLGAFAPRQG